MQKPKSPTIEESTKPSGRLTGDMHQPENTDSPALLTRRSFLGGLGSLTTAVATAGTAAGLTGLAATPAAASPFVPEKSALEKFSVQPDRVLSLRNIHTLEELEITYWAKGSYIDDAVLSISHHMRDHRENETLLMDPALLDLLWSVRQKIDPDMRFDIISGYRTPKTNAMLRKRSRNVAKFSYHMVGRAVDVSTHKVSMAAVRDAGLAVKKGGVGYYPSSRFVHFDTGPLRNW